MTKINNTGDEQLRQRNKDSFQNAALYWNNLANERLFEISKQLLGIALIILPLTGSIALANKRLCPYEINLLLYGWILLFISIILGFIHIWTEAKYFNYLSNDSSTREEIWSDGSRHINDMDKATIKLGKVIPASTNAFLISQATFLLLGVIAIMIVIYNLFLRQGLF